MKAVHRLLLVCFSLLFIAVVVCAALLLCGVFGTQGVTAFIQQNAQGNLINNILIYGVAAVLVIVAVCMMFMGVKKLPPSSALIRTTDNGDVRVSIATVNQIAYKAAKAVAGVREVRISTEQAENGLVISIKAAMASDAVIPDVSKNAQDAVKDSVESMVGISVAAVPVMVDNSLSSGN